MTYTDFSFPIFLLAVALLYFTVFRRHQKVLLLGASIVFYLFSGPQYIVFVVAAALLVYLCTVRIQRLHDLEEEKLAAPGLGRAEMKTISGGMNKRRRRYMLIGLLGTISILAVIKYTNFALSGVSALLELFGINWSRTFHFVLPLGISFYTFMAVGYLLDIYWARYRAERNFFNLLLFLIYFPHIVQGPIARYNKLAPQFEGDHPFDYDRVTKGIQLFLWGAFEKMVIADRLAVFANDVYSKWQTLTGIPLLLAITFFSMQLYLDFQGCMDMGRGASQILGIELELNFARPYFSKNMAEFWRRWHITLGAWFKDYLLYPVSMSGLCKSFNKATKARWGRETSRTMATIIPTACVWLVTGIWHGAASRYLFWGIYHGIILIVSSLTERSVAAFTAKLPVKSDSFSFNLFRMARTFLISAVGRIFFVSSDFKSALRIIRRTFDFLHPSLYTLWDGSLYEFGLDRANFILALLLILLVWVVDNLQERMVIRDFIASQNIVFRWILYLALIVALVTFGMYGRSYNAAAFVYGQF